MPERDWDVFRSSRLIGAQFQNPGTFFPGAVPALKRWRAVHVQLFNPRANTATLSATLYVVVGGVAIPWVQAVNLTFKGSVDRSDELDLAAADAFRLVVTSGTHCNVFVDGLVFPA